MKQKILNKIKRKIEKIIDEIDEIGQNCSIQEGESERGEALWSAQMSLDEAIMTLDSDNF